MQRISLTILATVLLVAVVAAPAHATIRELADLRAHKGNASDRARVYIDGYSDLTPAAAVLGVEDGLGRST
jgi:hypothetical protein